MTASASGAKGFRLELKALYEGRSERAHRFRYGLLIFDVVTLLFIVATSFIPREVSSVSHGISITRIA